MFDQELWEIDRARFPSILQPALARNVFSAQRSTAKKEAAAFEEGRPLYGREALDHFRGRNTMWPYLLPRRVGDPTQETFSLPRALETRHKFSLSDSGEASETFYVKP